jgi:hypothetical protein
MMYAGIRLIQDIAYASEWQDDTSALPKATAKSKKKLGYNPAQSAPLYLGEDDDENINASSNTWNLPTDGNS